MSPSKINIVDAYEKGWNSTARNFMLGNKLFTRAFNNWQIGLRGDTTAPALAEAKRQIGLLLKDQPPSLLPQVDDRALRTLKFAELLPNSLALCTLAERNSDHAGAIAVSARPVDSV
jgi:ATP-dependent helicase Lhr and Lhr-like helicase